MSGSQLIAMLRKRLAALWLWQAMFVASVLIGYGAVQLTIWQEHQPLHFAAMDSRRTMYLADLGTFQTAQHIHAEHAKMAAETIFSRNPEGYDNPERVERLFNTPSRDQLNKDAARDADVFRQQQVHQKFESGQVRELQVDNNTTLISVEGQVLRTAVFNGRTVTDSKHVLVFLKLMINDDMTNNGKYPLVVVQYDTKFE